MAARLAGYMQEGVLPFGFIRLEMFSCARSVAGGLGGFIMVGFPDPVEA